MKEHSKHCNAGTYVGMHDSTDFHYYRFIDSIKTLPPVCMKYTAQGES